jgi:hypothetical protein
MKNDAHALLQFIGYPLEPIVALHVTKSYQSHIQAALSTAAFTAPVQPQNTGNTRVKKRCRTYK